jgi:hypothetical protein
MRTNQIGAVTFLDVLGWKGIWQRKDDAIADIQRLASLIGKTAEQQSRGKGTGIPSQTRVLIISDTIVISTDAGTDDAQDALELHGKICEKAIPESIERGIPVRGATSFGEFLIDDDEKILVGKAIDEAASWHETADWIGVFMSPSAAYMFDISKSKSWIEYEPPLKNSLKLWTYAVKWFQPSNDAKGEFLILKKHFALMSPIVPEFAAKFQNTILFIDRQINNTNGS